jgi:protein TonB
MHPRLYFTTSLLLSLALHALVLAAALFLIKPAAPELPLITPVRIVNLPQETVRKLPPLQRPVPPPVPTLPRPLPREKPLPPQAVPIPRKFGGSDEVTLPKTIAPRTGVPEGADQGKETGKTGPQMMPVPKETGPLPFLTRKDIDKFARRGMPEKRPGEDSVTLDTDEFKFISYNRWLKIKVESVLKYPELAAISGYQGALFIKFDILKDGSLGDVEVLKSSGYKILDDEALRSIRSAAPFQPLPEEWKMDRYSIRAAVIFYLGEGYIR